ncbi:prolyl 4-hydroxylase [Vigna unguiculata]|uniref:procollagen-proline 4-dioxygenase n=1 Tax=Vigna unguiculata TaxID=3917 RepID=A0A4D6KZE5_VIGUN|nr:prolyl 4-hydroxylase [Vigna unguiculata]
MVKARHSRLQKSWITRWSWVLVLAVLTMCMSLLILLLLALHLLSMPNTNTSFAPFKHNHLNSIARNASYISEGEDEQTERWVEILSWEPRAFLYHNFLTKEECEYLINIAKPNMKRSTVIETETGIIKTSSERTSFGTLLARGLDKTVRNIEKRIADFTHVPVENGEALQIVHYEVGEEYVPHHDYFMDDLHTANGGDRMATMLISDVEEGGETVFPDAKVNLSIFIRTMKLGPRITLEFYFKNFVEQFLDETFSFVSKEECEYLINIAKPKMQKSSVVDAKTGKSMDSRVRTSSGAFMARGRDQIVRDIEKRIADFTFIPVEHGEGLQVLHYEVGQKYEPHFDYFMDNVNTKNGGQRIATVLMYLSDVEEGGETVFPDAKGNVSSVPWWNELSECGKKGLSIKPKMGTALLFWSMKPDATLDPLSLHGGCPVIKGNKWSCTKWMRLKPYKA